MDAINQLADTLFNRLVWTSIQALLLIGVVYLAGRALPRLSAAMRWLRDLKPLNKRSARLTIGRE